MCERLLVDVVIVIHCAFVLFVVFGGLLVMRLPRLMWIHLPAVLWGATLEFAGLVCPLTPYEISLRARAGLAGYDTGFIEHYLLPVLYPAGLTRGAQLILGTLVIAVNLAIYARIAADRFRIESR